VIGHLGTRVSALIDGQLSAAEAERCWAHVHECHFCRDLVEREGWIKTQLAGLSFGGDDRSTTPDSLKGSLAHAGFVGATPPHVTASTRSRSSAVLLGGTALGAAVVGVLALGVAQGGAPADRRPPVTSLTRSVSPSPSAAVTVPATPATVTSRLRVPTHHVAGGIAGFKMVP
jgi:anti-sigma factor RsiW